MDHPKPCFFCMLHDPVFISHHTTRHVEARREAKNPSFNASDNEVVWLLPSFV